MTKIIETMEKELNIQPPQPTESNKPMPEGSSDNPIDLGVGPTGATNKETLKKSRLMRLSQTLKWLKDEHKRSQSPASSMGVSEPESMDISPVDLTSDVAPPPGQVPSYGQPRTPTAHTGHYLYYRDNHGNLLQAAPRPPTPGELICTYSADSLPAGNRTYCSPNSGRASSYSDCTRNQKHTGSSSQNLQNQGKSGKVNINEEENPDYKARCSNNKTY